MRPGLARRSSSAPWHGAGHEPDRLHRTAESVEEAAAAGHPALPVKGAAGARRHEAELDELVRATGAGRGAAQAGGQAWAGHRHVDAELGDGEGVPNRAPRPGVELRNRLTVDVLDAA